MGGNMRLRNKKTGEIVERSSIVTLRYKISSSSSSLVEAEEFGSIEQLNEEWEDYKPIEPLIKDEKIRKAVRAWAEANDVTKVWHEGSSVGFCDGAVSIKFHELCWEEIPKGEYTIEELCGEEEE